MDRTAIATSTASSAFDRFRQWVRQVTGGATPARTEPAPARESAPAVAAFQDLLEQCHGQRGGEISARQRADRMAALYHGAAIADRSAILRLITHEFAPDRNRLEHAVAAVQSADSDSALCHAEARLRLALAAPRAQFLKQFNLLPNGVKFLVDLRADVLRFMGDEPALQVLKVEIDALLVAWFDPGFLELRRITWESPAAILEKLMNYEAVHAMDSWQDLRNRLDDDRRCYAFFHPRMPDEPLIFVEIALVKGFPASVQTLLDVAAPIQDPKSADAAIFYSISNTQRGLHGVSFGNLLLKRVIEDLQRELPALKVFATLSPIPGFRKWVESAAARDADIVSAADREKIVAALPDGAGERPFEHALCRSDWLQDERIAAALRFPLEKLCARYLLNEKSGTRPLDPVAAFHLNNGARVNRILWLADTSERGMRQSYGLMASYRYDVREVDDNHERFAERGEVAAAPRVRRLIA